MCLDRVSTRYANFPDGSGGLTYRGGGPNVWGITAVTLLAGSAATAGIAHTQNKKMREAPDQAALDKAYSTQRATAWTSLGLLGGAGLAFTFSKVL